jgi:hypothetical protein
VSNITDEPVTYKGPSTVSEPLITVDPEMDCEPVK